MSERDPVHLTKGYARRIGRVVLEVEKNDRPSQRRHGPSQQSIRVLEPVVIRTRDFESESELLTVTPVIRTSVDGSDVYRLMDDQTRDVWTWFGLRAKHYANLAWLGDDQTDGWEKRIRKAWFILGRWRVEQDVRWAFPLKDSRFRVEGCLPQVMR